MNVDPILCVGIHLHECQRSYVSELLDLIIYFLYVCENYS